LNTLLHAISYRGALLSTVLHATVYMFLHNFLNALVQIANKMGLQKKYTERINWIATSEMISAAHRVHYAMCLPFGRSRTGALRPDCRAENILDTHGSYLTPAASWTHVYIYNLCGLQSQCLRTGPYKCVFPH
jgi:hypothetical protein